MEECVWCGHERSDRRLIIYDSKQKVPPPPLPRKQKNVNSSKSGPIAIHSISHAHPHTTQSHDPYIPPSHVTAETHNRKKNIQTPNYLGGNVIRSPTKCGGQVAVSDILLAHAEVRHFDVSVRVEQNVVQFQVSAERGRAGVRARHGGRAQSARQLTIFMSI